MINIFVIGTDQRRSSPLGTMGAAAHLLQAGSPLYTSLLSQVCCGRSLFFLRVWSRGAEPIHPSLRQSGGIASNLVFGRWMCERRPKAQ